MLNSLAAADQLPFIWTNIRWINCHVCCRRFEKRAFGDMLEAVQFYDQHKWLQYAVYIQFQDSGAISSSGCRTR